ncbi:tetratricopeptide repeat protein [Sphingomonas sp.]|jgi:tetratricopeptide (TPR) repeat protein|uniref:tetratricopeptide repeat protein n=1 Tax=Sphingomonas sp. TaxID=28214 RepID=UPI002E31899A|nr:tetratricopeptide repeat protein [Sphingomonas sp.]HEX4694736.1 tetratricopeptide repeat protein [Sphingomonas sp.]
MKLVARACLLFGASAAASFWIAAPAQSAVKCTFPRGDDTSVDEMIASIKQTNAACALPWRALKRQVADPAAKNRIEAAYREVAVKNPDKADAARARSADVEAAAGNPGPMLALADANVIAHPEDRTLANMSCFARAAYGFDIEHAMPYCDAAVDNGRPGYALVNRGFAELQLGKFRQAVDDFDEALSTRKELGTHSMVQAVFGRGVARLRLGDAAGRKDIDAAVGAYRGVTAEFADFGVTP